MLMFILGMFVGLFAYFVCCGVYIKRKKITNVQLQTKEQEMAPALVMVLHGRVRYSTGLLEGCKIARQVQEENPDLSLENVMKMAENIVKERYDSVCKDRDRLAEIIGYKVGD